MNTINTDWSKTTKYLVGVGLILLGIYILYLSREVIPLLIIAALIAVITRPVITWLHMRIHLKRGLAVAIVYLGVAILFPLALLLAIPAVVNAVHYGLTLDYSGFLRSGFEWARSTLASLRAAQLPLGSLDAYVDQLINELLTSLQNAAPSAAPELPSAATILQALGAALTRTFSTVTRLAGAVVSNVVQLIFIFLASIYMNLSAHSNREALLRALPPVYQPEIDLLLARIARVWSAFFRGQLMLMLVIAVISWLGLTVLGIPGALYLGIIAGLLELIPNLGPVIATIPAVMVALLQGSTYLPFSHLTMALLVILLYVLVQQLENTLIVPWMLGGAVGLPPLVVMTGVLVGATTFGLLGALLATPVIASAREILRYIYAKLLGKDPFPPGQPVLDHERQPTTRLHQLLRSWAQQLARSRMPARDKPVEDHPQRQSSDPEGKAFPPRK